MEFSPQQILTQQQMVDAVATVFLEHLPFNQLIGMQLGVYNREKVELQFPIKPELIGNKLQNILHGGVISSALDAVGGLFACRSVFQDVDGISFLEFQKKFSKIGTIDLRIDYLRPGRGEHFVASASLLRAGNKVAVFRMDFTNEKGILLAVGTGTYMVG